MTKGERLYKDMKALGELEEKLRQRLGELWEELRQRSRGWTWTWTKREQY